MYTLVQHGIPYVPAASTVCIDINPAVVTKLADRGSFQTIGIVTDVGLFLEQLVDHLCVAKARLY